MAVAPAHKGNKLTEFIIKRWNTGSEKAVEFVLLWTLDAKEFEYNYHLWAFRYDCWLKEIGIKLKPNEFKKISVEEVE